MHSASLFQLATDIAGWRILWSGRSMPASQCVSKHLFSDHMGVVKSATTLGDSIRRGVADGGCHLRRGCAFYSGILRDAFREKGARLIQQASHVKSHQADSGHLPAGLTMIEQIAILGNMAADEVATDSLAAHPSYDQDHYDDAKRHFHIAKNVCHLAALALPAWHRTKGSGKLLLREEVLTARSRRKHSRHLQQDRLQQPLLLPADGGHFWVAFGAHGFRCTFCSTRATTKTKPTLATQPCKRDLGKLGKVVESVEHTQHSLHWSVHQKLGLRVLCCSRCDSYARVAPKHLLAECIPKIIKPNWERLPLGQFPTHRFGNTRCMALPFRADPFVI